MTLVRKGSEIPEPKGERCKRCMKVIREDGHNGYCSSSCFTAASEEVSQATLRRLVLERDNGVCAECGVSCLALWDELCALRDNFLTRPAESSGLAAEYDRKRKTLEARVHQLVRLGFPRGPVERGESLWACDHKQERAAGGASNLDQAQTLCLACHGRKSSEFATKRAASRKTSKDARLSGKRRRFGR